MFLLPLIPPGSLGIRKLNGKRKGEEEAMCTQVITKTPPFYFRNPEAACVLLGSAFLVFSIFISYPKVLVFISSILLSILSLNLC